MIGALRRSYSFLAARPTLRVVLQALVSLIMIGGLVVAAQRSNLVASLAALSPLALATAALFQIIAFLLNGRRWQVTLDNVGIREPWLHLTEIYFIGLFFSLFLPTGTGGDAVRVYDVARRSRRLRETIVATLQERLIGLGISFLIGLVATISYLPLVPAQLRFWVVLILVLGVCAVALLIYPSIIFMLVARLWGKVSHNDLLRSFAGRPLVARVIAALQPVAEIPALSPLRLVQLLALASCSTLLGIGMYYALAQSLAIPINFMAFCLVVPLVWVIRMAPVSLNGIGVGEGAFVFLMSLFAVQAGPSLALALAVFGLQTSCALFGGLLLALRMARGAWSGTRSL